MSSLSAFFAVRDIIVHRRFRPRLTPGARYPRSSQRTSFRSIPVVVYSTTQPEPVTRFLNNNTNPELPANLYKAANSFQRRDNAWILGKPEMGFKEVAKKNLKCLDIGCGTGDFTREILLHLGDPSLTIVGVDISPEMIDCARRHSHHANITYDVLDIGERDVSGFVNKYGEFDRLYSFFCLNWVKDRATALRNITTFLRTDGEYLLLFPVKTNLYSAWREMALLPRWKACTKRFEQFIPTSQDYRDIHDAAKYMRISLEEAGLVPHTCEIFNSKWDFRCKQDMIKTLVPLVPVMKSQIQKEEKQDFYDDLHDVLSKHCSLGSSKFTLDIDLCAVQGSKLDPAVAAHP